MYVLKGFAAHSQFQLNTPTLVNPIGELSTHSMTYSKEKGSYSSDVAPNINVVSFLSAADGVAVEANPLVTEQVLTILNWLYNNTLASSGPLYADEILHSLIENFSNIAKDFASGEMANDGTYYIPEWLSFELKDASIGDNFIRIWFADASFQLTYDEYEIDIVPPIDDLNYFFRTGQEVENVLNARTLTQALEKAQEVRGPYPYTVQIANSYLYHDPINPARRVPSYWIIQIYGEAGNNVDSIKDALVDYILTHSSHPREDWIQVLPDIFRRTEFIMVPNWDSYAIPNRTVQPGIYSPIVNPGPFVQKVVEYAPEYSTVHIGAHTTIFGHAYKSLAIASIGNIENRDNLFEIQQVFPDYIAVSSTSLDFNRMSEETKAWSEMLANMLLISESMTRYSQLPRGYTRVIRQGVLFLVRGYQNIQYLVVAKSNFPDPDA